MGQLQIQAAASKKIKAPQGFFLSNARVPVCIHATAYFDLDTTKKEQGIEAFNIILMTTDEFYHVDAVQMFLNIIYL